VIKFFPKQIGGFLLALIPAALGLGADGYAGTKLELAQKAFADGRKKILKKTPKTSNKIDRKKRVSNEKSLPKKKWKRCIR
jgi:hypothetical protein